MNTLLLFFICIVFIIICYGISFSGLVIFYRKLRKLKNTQRLQWKKFSEENNVEYSRVTYERMLRERFLKKDKRYTGGLIFVLTFFMFFSAIVQAILDKNYFAAGKWFIVGFILYFIGIVLMNNSEILLNKIIEEQNECIPDQLFVQDENLLQEKKKITIYSWLFLSIFEICTVLFVLFARTIIRFL